ncbi:uncharacterized protein LOC128390777 [Panonychus citri]|uniref:uncharacterized protein LOC128390777 n=1 Tax=Panonychus citri TaxID=50023 RepID=UPI002306FEB8|nr:uncharacterized protein LOC128390777 [Panonychus citri]
MVAKCCLVSCKRPTAPDRTLFRFPLDRAKRLVWFEAINSDLPEDVTVDCLNNKYVCDVHFPSIMYATSGNRKRLFCNACPSEAIAKLPRMPESVILDENKKSVGTQVHFASKEREIISLKKKLAQLTARMDKLKADPPTSLIYKNRHKLAKFVTDEAWLLFDCAVQNQQKGIHGHRHTMDVKKLTQSIAQKNRMAFKMLKPIFSLPSLRTLGRMEAEENLTLTTNTTENITTSNSNQLIDNSSQPQIEESSSADHLQMDQTSHTENITIEDPHIGNITFVSVPYPL